MPTSKKPNTKGENDDDDDDDDDDDGTDQREAAKGLIREVVDEALVAFAKKNKPAPRRTSHSEDEYEPGVFEKLFGLGTFR